MIAAKRFAQVNGSVLLGMTLFTGFQYPEMISQPSVMMAALIRNSRQSYAGIMMATDYYFSSVWDSQLHRRNAERLYKMFRKNKGIYIKTGQHMGQMDNLVTQEYVEVFEPLCNHIPISPFEDVKDILEEETGRKLDDMFSEFGKSPIASASMAQVHKARLRSTGELVAVKVQHKRLREELPGDLRMINLAIDVGEKIFPRFKYKWLADEVSKNIPIEMDFRIEAQNAKRCKAMFANNKNVHVPTVYDEFTSDRTLVMSFEEGISVTKVKEMDRQGIDLKQLAQVISETFNQMIFEEGFVHGDPHPGNMHVRKGEDGELKLILLDHGIYTQLDTKTRHAYTKLWRGILSQDEQLIRQGSVAMGVDLYDMFAAMVADRTYEDLMDKEKKHQLKSRLSVDYTDKAKEQRYKVLKEKAVEINNCLAAMDRELLILFKTNDYLRAIDKRLGNPTNTFNIINEVSWRVYKREVCRELSGWDNMREVARFYLLKLGLFLAYLNVRFRAAFGLKVDASELEDFDLDVIEVQAKL